MANFTLANFKEICEKDKFYRLDIVRGVSLEDSYDPSMPFRTLIVNFSLYSDEYQSLDKIKNIPSKDIFKDKQIKWIEVNNKNQSVTLEVKVDVTNQIFLKPGTVWRNGSPVWEPSEFLNVSINHLHTKFVTINSEKKVGPKMPYIYNGFFVQFLKIPNSKVNGSNVDVLIPTTEIIRYYFSGSTYFTQQLFNGALKEFKSSQQANKLFSEFKHDEDRQSVYIWLNRACYDSDAILIARALTDPVAMAAMSFIYASLVNTKLYMKKHGYSANEACPRTNLPFLDGTDMEVSGQWLSRRKGEKDYTTFIVRTIERCDHKFPFNRIEIESIDSYKSSGKVDVTTPPKRDPKKKGKQNPKPPILTQDEKPTNTISAEELNFYQQRFSHLENVEIEKIEKVSDKEKKRRFKEEDEENNSAGSTLPGDYKEGNELQAWQNRINDAEPIPISDRLTNVINAISTILQNREELSVSSLPKGFTDDLKPISLYSFERPRNKSSNYIWNQVEGRQRKALFLAISNHKGETVYLLEIEGRDNVGFSLYLFSGYKYAGFDECNSARSLMFEIANNSGHRIASDVLQEFKFIASLKHIATEDDSYSDRIERAIDGLMANQKSDFSR